jgi:hypothetical protein
LGLLVLLVWSPLLVSPQFSVWLALLLHLVSLLLPVLLLLLVLLPLHLPRPPPKSELQIALLVPVWVLLSPSPLFQVLPFLLVLLLNIQNCETRAVVTPGQMKTLNFGFL